MRVETTRKRPRKERLCTIQQSPPITYDICWSNLLNFWWSTEQQWSIHSINVANSIVLQMRFPKVLVLRNRCLARSEILLNRFEMRTGFSCNFEKVRVNWLYIIWMLHTCHTCTWSRWKVGTISGKNISILGLLCNYSTFPVSKTFLLFCSRD